MHIFIDESGNFVIPDVAKPKISSVTSLTVPDEYLENINIEFLPLRRSWGFDDEVKGSQLSEKQISDVTLLPDLTISVQNRLNKWTGLTGFTGLYNSVNSVNPEQSCKSCHFFGAGNGLYSLQSVQFSPENMFFY